MARENAKKARSVKANSVIASNTSRGLIAKLKGMIKGQGRDLEAATPTQTKEENLSAFIDYAIKHDDVEEFEAYLKIVEEADRSFTDEKGENYNETISDGHQFLKGIRGFFNNHVEMRQIEQRLESSKSTIEKIVSKRNEATEKIKSLLVMDKILDNREDIIKYTDLFVEAANDAKELIDSNKKDIEKYKELTGKDYQGSFESLYFDEDTLEIITITIPTTIKLIEEQIELPGKSEEEKNKLGNIKNTLKKYINNSKVFVQNPKEIENIISGVIPTPEPTKGTTKKTYEELLEEFKVVVEKGIIANYKEKEEALLKLETPILVHINLDEDDEKFKDIPDKKKEEIKEEIEIREETKFYAKYSKTMVDYVFNTLDPKLSKLKKEIETLRELETIDYAKCDDVEKMIYDIQKDIKANKLHRNIMVSFDKNDKNLKINFKPDKKSGTIEVYNVVILNEKALSQINPLSKSEKNNLEEELKKEFAKLYGELFTIHCQQIETLTNQKEKMLIQQRKINELLDATGEYSKFARISKETRDTTVTQARNNYLAELINKYGQGLSTGIENIIIPTKGKIEKELVVLLQADYNDEKYKEKYPIVRGYINELITKVNQPEIRGLGIKVEFDEKKEKLIISFGNEKIKNYESQIINDRALADKKKAEMGVKPEQPVVTSEKGTPVVTTTTEKGQKPAAQAEVKPENTTGAAELKPEHATGATEAKPKSAIIEPIKFDGYEQYKNLYIAGLEATNDLKKAISASNAIIAASSYASFVLNTANMEKVIKAEKIASEKSSEILEQELVLSDIRYKVRSKYGKSILLDEEIKNIKEEKVNFGPEAYAEYVTARNNTIISAEEQLIIKHNEIKNTSDDTKKAELLKEKQMILDYIEAQNSAVSRRIIEESLGNPGLNITQLFEKRNAEMKETRDRIRAIALNKEVVEIKPVIKNEEPLSAAPAPEEPTIKVKTTSLNMKKIQKINPDLTTMFENQDAIKVVIAKNKVQIKINQQLREALSKFNAKIGLINKVTHGHNYAEVRNDQEEQEFTLAEGQEINPDDYYIRIRADKDKLAEFELEGKVRSR